MQTPQSKDIEDAKQYLIERLDAERTMTTRLEEYFSDAARRICAIAYRYGKTLAVFSFDSDDAMKKEVEDVIKWLKEQIDADFTALAEYKEDEDKDGLIAFVGRESNGMTFDERLDGYMDRYEDELEILIGAGLALGIAESELAESIGENLRSPWNNPLLYESGISKPRFGRGKVTSMLTATDNLTRFGIASGWMWSGIQSMMRDGAKGYRSYRGSSYPCEQCDDETKYIHTFADPFPPYHSHCCCYIVPIY